MTNPDRKEIDRRKFLYFTGMGAVSLLSGGFKSNLMVKKQVLSEANLSKIEKNLAGESFHPDIEITLKATRAEVPILPGDPTEVWLYKGELVKGDSGSLQNLEDSYLGPIIRVRKGKKVRIRFINDIPEETIIHWHGLHVPADMDGHPRLVISQGKSYVYEFEVRGRAGTYWFHPHPHGRTGSQVYRGLTGLFLESDDEEDKVSLPYGKYDIPLVIQDRTFDASNQLVYLKRGMMNHMERMMGFLGEKIMINGKPDFVLPVATRAYRLRLLNGSNSRIYKLAWRHGEPLVIIGTDGGLLGKPVRRQYVMLGPGERLELWADFSRLSVGSERALMSLPFKESMMEQGMMGRGMMNRNLLPNDADFTIFRLKVVNKEKETLSLPERLSRIRRHKLEEAINHRNPRTFRMSMQHMNWTINGRTFRMEEVAEEEKVQLDTLEVWQLENDGGSMGMMGMMRLAHPIHLHGPQFQVIERRGARHKGYVDEGWKDTVLLMPGERVKILVKFTDYTGLYLYHCHNLEHEDMGMMRNYLIEK